jgi:MarR family transcriptional regulator, organic hydroperoxide resistance regulator
MTAPTPVESTEPETSVSSHTIHLLRSATAMVERAIARALEPHGLTAVQFAVLQVMGEADDQKLGCGELGKRLSGPSSDVTRLLDRLEAGGLVSRERDVDDRRVVHTKISEKGREVLAAAAPTVRAAEEQALASISIADRRHLASMLSAVQRNVPGN